MRCWTIVYCSLCASICTAVRYPSACFVSFIWSLSPDIMLLCWQCIATQSAYLWARCRSRHPRVGILYHRYAILRPLALMFNWWTCSAYGGPSSSCHRLDSEYTHNKHMHTRNDKIQYKIASWQSRSFKIDQYCQCRQSWRANLMKSSLLCHCPRVLLCNAWAG